MWGFAYYRSCCCSVAKWCLTLCDPMDCSTPDFALFHYLLEFAQIHVHWVCDAIQSSHPLSSPSPPAFILSNELAFHMRWLKYWSFSFSISPSNEYSGLISFRIDWHALPYCPGDSQESSLVPQFEKINSLALILLYGPTLTSIDDYWKNHSFDYTDLCLYNINIDKKNVVRQGQRT